MFKNVKIDPENYKGLHVINNNGRISISINNKELFGKSGKTKALGMTVESFNNLDELKQQEIMSEFKQKAISFYQTGGEDMNSMLFAWEEYLPEVDKADYIEWAKKGLSFKELARRNYINVKSQEKDRLFG